MLADWRLHCDNASDAAAEGMMERVDGGQGVSNKVGVGARRHRHARLVAQNVMQSWPQLKSRTCCVVVRLRPSQVWRVVCCFLC